MRVDQCPRYDVLKVTLNDDRSLNHGHRVTHWPFSLLVDLKLADFDQVVNSLSLDFAEDRVLLFKPIARRSYSHEELGAVLVPLTFVGHCDDATVRESESLMELIHERFPIGALTTVASASRVAALYHEVLDHPMEHRVVVVALKTKLDKVAAGPGSLPSPQVDFNLAIVCLKNDLG